MRVKGGNIRAKRRKKILKRAQGYYGNKSTHYKKANEQLMKSDAYAFHDRKKLKSEYRKLWIARISAACKQEGISYSRFIAGLNKANVKLNRKMISEMAIHNPELFKELITLSQDNSQIQNSNNLGEN